MAIHRATRAKHPASGVERIRGFGVGDQPIAQLPQVEVLGQELGRGRAQI
jgi:hypothetical protein